MRKFLWCCAVTGGGKKGRVVKDSTKRTCALIMLLCMISVSLVLAGCGGSGGGGVSPEGVSGISSEAVSGVAAVGAGMAGEVAIKDDSTPPREKRTVIGSDGSFAFDVSDMKGPFILQAKGKVDGEYYTLHSFAEGPGTANINPLGNAAVAAAADDDDDIENVYHRRDRDKIKNIKLKLPKTIEELLGKLQPLLERYDAERDDPIKIKFKKGRHHRDSMFDDVKVTVRDGVLTIVNKKTKAVIFTAQVSDILNGDFTGDDLPSPGSVPGAPAGASATGGDGQVNISWESVSNATSYNIYWSPTPGVTTDNGTEIIDAASPYTHSGLTAGATYYYIVTALNDVGQSEASAEVSATTNATPSEPAVPAAPTGVIATGGTNQTAVSWPPVSGADSYNLYWSITPGVTTAAGQQIAGVTSPAVHTGLDVATTYYYIVTAVNGVGESAPSVQVAAATLPAEPAPTVPATPTDLSAAGGANQITLSWPAVPEASSYNVYWSTASGVNTSGTLISGATSPYIHTGLSAGATYYYVVTAVNSVGESAASPEANGTTDAPLPQVPNPPTGVSAAGGAREVTISWSASSGALSYNLYWSTTSGVTIGTGTKISNAVSPYVQTGLADGTTYYYIVTAVNGDGESAASSQASAATDAPLPQVPNAPTGVTAAGGANQITISWPAVSGADSYNIYWSITPGVTTAAGQQIVGVTSPAVHTGLDVATTYYYIVTALNGAGESAPSSQASATTDAPAPPVIDGAALYTQYCSGCHGNGKKGSSVSSIQNAISSNRGGMGSFNFLTTEQIQAISAAR